MLPDAGEGAAQRLTSALVFTMVFQLERHVEADTVR